MKQEKMEKYQKCKKKPKKKKPKERVGISLEGEKSRKTAKIKKWRTSGKKQKINPKQSEQQVKMEK